MNTYHHSRSVPEPKYTQNDEIENVIARQFPPFDELAFDE
jgi:hypothetical protein